MIEKLIERWPMFFSDQIAPLAIASLLVVVLVIARRLSPSLKRHTYSRISNKFRVLSIAVIVAWAFGYAAVAVFFSAPRVLWWENALPVTVAALGMFALLLVGKSAADVPTVQGSVVRRTWRSFCPTWLPVSTAVLAFLLIALTLAAGAASSPDDEGKYVLLEFKMGGGSTNFYGWTYGVPVLVAMILMLSMTILNLRAVALPRFQSPATVVTETAQRRDASFVLSALALGTMLLTLGGALRRTAGGGLGWSGVELAGTGEVFWSGAGFTAIAPTMLWVSQGLCLIGFVLLLLIALGWRWSSVVMTRAGSVRPVEGREYVGG